MNLLHVDSSITGPLSVSRSLTADIVAAEQRRISQLQIIYRDVANAPLAHLSGEHIAASAGTVPEGETLRAELDAGRQALDEFMAADIVVVGAPMYNFGIPSQLKAWIDRLAVRGVTFSYSDKGPVGLAGGKRVILASSRGGFYGPETPAASFEHQESYLKSVFGFFGIEDIAVVRAEGVNLGPEQREQAIAAARSELAQLAA